MFFFRRSRRPRPQPTYRCSLEPLEGRELLAVSYGLERAGAILTYYGQPIRLLAYGDYGLLTEGVFDHRTFFQTLTSYGGNHVRVWVNYHWTNELTPFVKTQAGTNPRYRLLQQNDAFFTRLRTFVEDAQQYGVIVQVCLFDGVALSTSRPNRWNWTPYNDTKNVDVSYLQSATRLSDFQNPNHALWRDVNLALTRRVVDTLGDLGNVIYEVANEPSVHGLDVNQHTFHQAVVSELYNRLALHPGSKIISVNVDTTTGGTDLRNWALNDPRVDVVSYHVSSVSGAFALYGVPKPVILSNDGDLSDHTYAQCVQHSLGNCDQLAGNGRLERIWQLLYWNFYFEPFRGYRHIELLDKGLNGMSWLSGTATTAPNYNPRNANIDRGILGLMAYYAVGGGAPGTPDGVGDKHSSRAAVPVLTCDAGQPGFVSLAGPAGIDRRLPGNTIGPWYVVRWIGEGKHGTAEDTIRVGCWAMNNPHRVKDRFGQEVASWGSASLWGESEFKGAWA